MRLSDIKDEERFGVVDEAAAIIERVSEEEYSKDLSLGKIFNGVLEMIKDPIFINFFYLSQTPSAEQP